MYKKIINISILFVACFVGMLDTTYWWEEDCWWERNHGGDYRGWKEMLSDAVITLINQGDLEGAARQKEAETLAHDNKTVKYCISRNGDSVHIACDNHYFAYYDLPPPVNGLCGLSGELFGTITGPSCINWTWYGFAIGWSNPVTYSWWCTWTRGWSPVSCNARYAAAECAPGVSNNTLRANPLTSGSCKYGTASTLTSATDATGKVTYTWTCEKTWSPTVSCNAYYKPLCIPSATDGCCDERRAANDPNNITQFGHPPRKRDQCSYSVIPNQPGISMTGNILSTQNGPTIVYLTGGAAQSMNGVTWNCQMPVGGRPRVVCSADPFTTITTTSLSRFTLPSSVTQRIGSCRIIFDAPDVCSPREDVIRIDATAVDPEKCNPNITDPGDPRFCGWVSTANERICVSLQDKFWNPVNPQYINKEMYSVFTRNNSLISTRNLYFSTHNSGSVFDFVGGGWIVVADQYCQNICLPWDTCCINPADPSCNTNPICTPASPVSTECPCTLNDSRTECKTCIPSSTTSSVAYTGSELSWQNCTLTPLVTDWSIPYKTSTNICPGVGPSLITIPWWDTLVDNIIIRKPITGKLEVKIWDSWTTDGEQIMYDELYTYRITLDGGNDACNRWIIDAVTVIPVGWSFSWDFIRNNDGTFSATVIRDTSSTPTTDRWISINAKIILSGWQTYGLTARADDFEDTPLTITGRRMKWVRIIGAAGSNITSFNLNNAGVIWEDSSASTVNMRNAILKNVWLLTRSIEPNRSSSINGVYYAEWDYTYTQLLGMVSNWFRTVIVRGNLTIDTTFPRHDSTAAIIWVIVVKDTTGNKGNIIIKNDVTSMRGVLFAEGSVYGETQTFGNIPLTKLILKWSLFSRNTIGGSAEANNLYVSGGATTTDFPTAFLQDLNNVRNGYGCTGWSEGCYKNYPDPFIVEYENTQSDPPPGFSL